MEEIPRKKRATLINEELIALFESNPRYQLNFRSTAKSVAFLFGKVR